MKKFRWVSLTMQAIRLALHLGLVVWLLETRGLVAGGIVAYFLICFHWLKFRMDQDRIKVGVLAVALSEVLEHLQEKEKGRG